MPRPDPSKPRLQAVLRHADGTDVQVTVPDHGAAAPARPATVRYNGRDFNLSGDMQGGVSAYDEVPAAVATPTDGPRPAGGWHDPDRPQQLAPDYDRG